MGSTIPIDEAGKKYGKLFVLRMIDDRRAHRLGVMWYCLCSCGGSKAVYGVDLRNGSVSSCGCLRVVGVLGVSRPDIARLRYRDLLRSRWCRFRDLLDYYELFDSFVEMTRSPPLRFEAEKGISDAILPLETGDAEGRDIGHPNRIFPQ